MRGAPLSGKAPWAEDGVAAGGYAISYRESFATPSPEAYVTLLSDVISNDATLFMRADQVEAAWRLLVQVLDAWKGESRQ
jgi:glucose-6-phosphate 1-dehydrogenase